MFRKHENPEANVKASFDLGWEIIEHGDYRLELPRLSNEEKELIFRIEEHFRNKSAEQEIRTREESEEVLQSLLKNYSEREGIYLDNEQMQYLVRTAAMHIYGFCFLDELLADRNIEEISIIGTGKPAYVYLKNKGWRSVNACFTDEQAIADVVNKMAHSLGRRITLQSPRLDAMLPNGDRLHASLPPISNGEITIRRFREVPYSPPEISDSLTMRDQALAYLSLIMQGDNSIIIAGNTASGKTTTLNALFSFVPLSDRVLITEETPEINIPHAHSLRLIANKDMGISLQTLVYDSFRMRPDRVIVGEIRNGEEAAALFDVLLAGQARGSYATMHGQSASEALQRLKSFGISEMDLGSISCIVVQKRMLRYDNKAKRNFEIRRVVEIAEIADRKPVAVFSYDLKSGSLSFKGSRLLEAVADKLGLSRSEINSELKARQQMIRKSPSGYSDFFKKFQKQFYGLNHEGS